MSILMCTKASSVFFSQIYKNVFFENLCKENNLRNTDVFDNASYLHPETTI